MTKQLLLAMSRYGRMQASAADHLSCPRKSVAYDASRPGRHGFSGCGGTVERLSESDWHWYRLGASRFAVEMSCGLENTTDTRIDITTRVVEGCGNRITYIWFQGNWIANVRKKAGLGSQD